MLTITPCACLGASRLCVWSLAPTVTRSPTGNSRICGNVTQTAVEHASPYYPLLGNLVLSPCCPAVSVPGLLSSISDQRWAEGVKTRWHEPFRLDGARLSLFQTRPPAAGEDCMNSNAYGAVMQCKATLFLRFTMVPQHAGAGSGDAAIP